MRIAALTVVALGAISLAAPAHAQTYGSDYPVCLHVYGPINYYECSYTSLPQCNMSAAGRAAQCIVNPYLASATEYQPVRRRHRSVY